MISLTIENNVESFNAIMENTFGKIPTQNEHALIRPLSSQPAANTIDSETYVEQVAQVLNAPTPNYLVFEEETISVTYDPSPAMTAFVREM